jgi:hypothetical protein
VKIDSLLGSEQEHAKSKHRCALSTAFCRALDEITDRKIGECARCDLRIPNVIAIEAGHVA